ncbi:hypothetical protein J2Y86_005916 [Pseudomonas migulae]|uniref:hypothetical protein n=1 Tax=Pseudomonas migulae TaxID=78543 RepID=UPI00209F639F|nr:hypothetical protein [Pseudomonas migulae]MCP1501209.1 hypothetical protein [Pseudomonas migulae]
MKITFWNTRFDRTVKNRQLVISGLFLACAAVISPNISMAANKPVPSRPFVETIENCKEYKDEAYHALHAQFEKELSCISSTSANISKGMECDDLTGRVYKGILAWPHCQDAEYHCALVRASDDAYQCMKDARAQKSLESPSTDKIFSDVIKSDKLVSEIKDKYQLIKDPKEYLKSAVINKLSDESRELITKAVFNEEGQISPYGAKVTNQFYAWGFKKTALNPKLLSQNPIIQAIQKESFGALGNMQQQMLGEILNLRQSIKSMDDSYAGSAKHSSVPIKASISNGAPSSSPDCAILSDGIKASNMSIDHPESYATLIEKCGG